MKNTLSNSEEKVFYNVKEEDLDNVGENIEKEKRRKLKIFKVSRE